MAWAHEMRAWWAADELPRHRGAGAGRVVRALVGSVAHLSRSLRGSRPDHGDRPTALGRRDIESFLHRLAYLAATGQISPELRAKICRDVKRVLGRIRALGLTRPGGPAPVWAATSPWPSATSRPSPNAVNPAATSPGDHGAAVRSRCYAEAILVTEHQDADCYPPSSGYGWCPPEPC